MDKNKDNITKQVMTILKEDIGYCFEKMKAVPLIQVGYCFINIKWLDHFQTNFVYEEDSKTFNQLLKKKELNSFNKMFHLFYL